MSQTSHFARRLKNKHVRHEYLNRSIVNNHTQTARSEFPYISLSCIYDEMKPNPRRISQVSIRTRK